MKKGEKGIAILAPLIFKKQSDEEDSDSETTRVLRGFKVVHVFDVSQTDGKPLPEFAAIHGDPGEHLQQVRLLIENEGITLRYEPILGGALGSSEPPTRKARQGAPRTFGDVNYMDGGQRRFLAVPPPFEGESVG